MINTNFTKKDSFKLWAIITMIIFGLMLQFSTAIKQLVDMLHKNLYVSTGSALTAMGLILLLAFVEKRVTKKATTSKAKRGGAIFWFLSIALIVGFAILEEFPDLNFVLLSLFFSVFFSQYFTLVVTNVISIFTVDHLKMKLSDVGVISAIVLGILSLIVSIFH